jgi:hypothetical protein
MPSVAARPVTEGPFDLLPRHWKQKTLLTKTWQAPIVHGVTTIWAQRCEGYWRRIEQRYGIVVTDERNAYDDETGTITTFAAILLILPGERYAMPRGENGNSLQ